MAENKTHEKKLETTNQNHEISESKALGTTARIANLLSQDLDPLFIKPLLIEKGSGWFGHVPFANWLVKILLPSSLVELGTHNGVSYSAFCSSVLREGLTTRCYAVGTWKGDQHAGFYGEEIYQQLKVFHDSNYKSFSTLIRASFDEAVQFFDDGTIDILHIDGLHTYEAVSHDFKTWKDKVSDRGIILFHDINEYKEGFQVWKFWQEMKKQYPFFEFTHSHGLGIIAIGNTPPLIIKELCSLPEDLKVLIASKFQKIGTIWAELASTIREKSALTKELTALNIKVKEEEKTKNSLSDRVNKLEKGLQAKDQQIESLSNALTNEQDLLKATIEKKNDQIESLDHRNRLQEESLKRLKEDIQNLKAQSKDAQVLQDEISKLKTACEKNSLLLNESEEKRKVLERKRIETAKNHEELKSEQIKLSSALSEAKADTLVLKDSLKRERLSAQNAVAKIRLLEEKKGTLLVKNLTAAKVQSFLTSKINLLHKKLSGTGEINLLRLQKLAKQYRDLSTNKAEIHNLNHKISELKSCQNLLNLQNFQLNQTLSELQSENFRLKVDNATLSENLSSKTKQLRNILGATHKYQEDLSRIVNSKKWRFVVSITALLTTPKRIASVFRLYEINRRKTYKQVYKVIQESNLFDPEWYLDNYEDLVGNVLDPLDHYIKFGSHEGRNPSLYFDTSLYLQLYPDVNPVAYEPLLHYITHGKKEGRLATYLQFVYDKISSSGLFDVEWYKRTYLLDTLTESNSSDATNDPISHYIQIGANLGYNPSPTFETNFYKNSYTDVAEDTGNPLLHYILFGQAEGRKTTQAAYNYHLIKNSPLFDGEYYKKTYELDNNVDLISHYFEEGVKLSYNPSPYFETSFYLNRYPEVANSNINPLLHYINYGQKEGRLATEYENARRIVQDSRLFDDIWYQQVYKIDENPVEHYLREGAAEGFNPSQFFDTLFYLSQYPDIGGTNPLVHFETSGRSEGRFKTEREYHYEQIKASGYFDSEWYQNEYLEVLHGVDPIYHYLDLGGLEGLNPSPDFDTEFYLEHYPDAQDAPNPLLHYLASGKNNFTNFKQLEYQIIKNSEYFDIDWYSEKYQEVEDPIRHYIETGVSEGNNPSLDFDTKFYLDQYQDVAAYGLNPLYHYIVAGKAEGRYRTFEDYQYHIIKNSELFDQAWYRNQYSIYEDPARHYIEIGVFSGADPSPQFSTLGYLHRYPDVAKSEINPLFHYIQYGKEELRDCTKTLIEQTSTFTKSPDTRPRIIQMTPARPQNPYYWMIPEILQNSGWQFSFETSWDRVAELGMEKSNIIAHFHQLEPFYHSKTNSFTETQELAEKLIQKLVRLKEVGIKLVWTKHNPLPHNRQFEKIDRELIKSVFNLVDGVIVLGNHAAETLVKEYAIKPPTVIHHPSFKGVYPDSKPSKDLHSLLGLLPETLIFGQVGRLQPYKGLEFLIQTHNQFVSENSSKSALVIVGDTNDQTYADHLKKLCGNNQYVINSAITDKELTSWVRALDVSVFSFQDIWTSSSVILSLGCKIPVIAPNIGSLSDYVKDQNTGLLYTAGNGESLKAKMQEMITCDLMPHYHFMLEKFSRDFSAENIARKFEEFYRKIM